MRELEAALKKHLPKTLAVIQKRRDERRASRIEKAAFAISRAQDEQRRQIDELGDKMAKTEFNLSTAGKLTRLAREHVEKSSGRLTFARAMDMEIMSHPEIYEQILKDRENTIAAAKITRQQARK